MLQILVVEDEPIAQKIAKLTLSKLGCDLFLAENGAMALECVKSSRFDLIFMDLGLPDISGIEVTRKICAENWVTSNCSIIALTAHDTAEIRAQCLAAGMAGFSTKPLTVEKCKGIFDAQGLLELAI